MHRFAQIVNTLEETSCAAYIRPLQFRVSAPVQSTFVHSGVLFINMNAFFITLETPTRTIWLTFIYRAEPLFGLNVRVG